MFCINLHYTISNHQSAILTFRSIKKYLQIRIRHIVNEDKYFRKNNKFNVKHSFRKAVTNKICQEWKTCKATNNHKMSLKTEIVHYQLSTSRL